LIVWSHPALRCSPDGQTLASAGWDQTIKVWDPATGRQLRSRSAGHKGRVQVLAFAPDARQLATGGDDGVVHLWDVATGAARETLAGHQAPVRALSFAPDGTLASAGDDATVRIWHPGREGAPPRILRSFGDGESSLLFSPGGRTLVTGSVHGVLTVWDPVAGVPRQHIDQSKSPITALAFDATGEELLSGSGGAVLRYPGLPAPPDPPSELLPEKLHHDFRRGGAPPASLPLYYHLQMPGGKSGRLAGADADLVTRADDGGLRITLPADQDKRGVWVQAPTPLSGDFDVTVSYDLVAVDRPRNGFGVGVVLLVGSAGAEKMAKLCRLVRNIEGECYLADVTHLKKKGQRVSTKFVPALARAGQLRFVREGATLRYLVADSPGHGFREIHREEFGWHDLDGLKVMVTSHEALATIDARLIELRIRAGRFTTVAAPPVAALPRTGGASAEKHSPPDSGSTPKVGAPQQAHIAKAEQGAGEASVRPHRPWLKVAVILFSLLAVVGLGLGWHVRRRAGRIEASEGRAAAPTERRTFLRATCAGCGTTVKAPITRAGKKVKCPRCGEMLLLPGAVEPQAAAAAPTRLGGATTWRALAAAAGLALLAGATLFVMVPEMAGRPNFLNVLLGGEAVAGVEESGFSGQEYDHLQRPLRWTDGRARLVVPLNRDKLPRALHVQLPASRPDRAPPATLQIVVNERVLFNAEVPNGALDQTFALDPALLGDTLTLDILSNTFVPQAVPGSTNSDTRSLGVRVACIRLLGPE
jgi:ribosomal protein S27E